MKHFKKMLLIFICLFLAGSFFACDVPQKEEKPVEDNNTYKADTDISYIYDYGDFTYDVESLVVSEEEAYLPDLEGMNRAQIKYILDKLELTYEFKFNYTIITSEEELNMFCYYSKPYKAGDIIKKSTFFYVYTTVLPITHYIHDKLTIDVNDCLGKSFINDGIGIVTLVRTIDGDTAWFRDTITNEEFKLRFLCINTTESTKKHDPWGKEASIYTANILNNAQVIILESEPTNRMDVYGRYLGYVWVDGKLLNLMIVEEAYSPSGSSNSKYNEYFSEAMLHARVTGRRYYGEIDPNYDYEKGDYK